MKVCVVTQNHPEVAMGGAEFQSHLVAQELASRPGVEVFFLARGVPSSGHYGNPTYSAIALGAPSGLARRSLTFDAPKLTRVLQSIRPDLIYQRMRISYTGICQAYAQAAGIPLCLHLASDFDLDPRLVRPGRLSFNLPFEVLDTAIGNWGLRRASHVIVQTETQARLLRTHYRRGASVIVHNFQPLPVEIRPRSDDPLRVVWIGNLRPIKRPELFIELARRFAGRTDVEFLMAGRTYGSPFGQESLPPNLRYLGPLPRSQVLDLLNRSHVLINTSSTEGSPNTFIEAWSHGVVVASLNVDVDGALTKDGMGVLAGTMDGLVAKVDSLLNCPADRAAMSARAFAFVHERHSLRNATDLCDFIVASANAEALACHRLQSRL